MRVQQLVTGLLFAAVAAAAVAVGWSGLLAAQAGSVLTNVATMPTTAELRAATAAPASTSGGGEADRAVPVVSRDGATVTFVFGIGAAEMTAEDAEYIAVPDWESRRGAQRTDVMLLVITDPDLEVISFVSLPRDLWIEEYALKLNELLPIHGLGTLVSTVEEMTRLEIDHLVRTDFLGFAALTDALGGVDIRFEERVRDRNAHLEPTGPGVVTLDGPHALAWVRSRTTERQREDGTWVLAAEQASDLGRIDNQQRFLTAVWDELRGPQLVTRAGDLLEVAEDFVEVDEALTAGKVLQLAQQLSSIGRDGIERRTWPGDEGRVDGRWVFERNLEEEADLRREINRWAEGEDR